MEQIDSEPLSTSSRHTAFIIIRRQERFEASRGSSGQTEQASEEARDGAAKYEKSNIKRADTLMKEAVLNRPFTGRVMNGDDVQRSQLLSKI